MHAPQRLLEQIEPRKRGNGSSAGFSILLEDFLDLPAVVP
jgi:hypothetical protein